ncbi:MAG: hypothetical protein HXY34_05405 [Candidatus Thorarchaeota archaeon]|nr:hypothetical protein [Candidatus Thorarchaeota archaeon]
MRITGTQYTIEKKTEEIEIKSAGKTTDKIPFKGKSIDDITEEIHGALRRKGVTVQKASIMDALQELFPGARKHGPLS